MMMMRIGTRKDVLSWRDCEPAEKQDARVRSETSAREGKKAIKISKKLSATLMRGCGRTRLTRQMAFNKIIFATLSRAVPCAQRL
jgi:hypothetical protein